SPLVELSTGSDLETGTYGFPVVLCPNTNILMLKFMSMLETSGHLFRDCDISVTESHQAGKTSVPGTAGSRTERMSAGRTPSDSAMPTAVPGTD
ncbi:hypothetical protein QM326_38275, partial [Burkholderia cenocepacia]|nr:hypothetical protein [Burkholderia cenocepacia]